MIIIYSVMRQGSSYFTYLSQHLLELDIRSELFHRGELVSEDFLIDNTDIDLIDYKKNNPITYLQNNYPTRYPYFGFKMLQEQMGEMVSGTTQDICELFDKHFNVYPIILMRRPIDSYISLLKMQQITDDYKQDTTHIQVEIDTDKFLGYWNDCNYFLSNVYDYYRDRALVVSYANFANKSTNEAILYIQGLLRNKWNIFSTVGGSAKLTVKQDKNIESSHSVTNWQTFLHEMSERNETWKLDYYPFLDDVNLK